MSTLHLPKPKNAVDTSAVPAPDNTEVAAKQCLTSASNIPAMPSHALAQGLWRAMEEAVVGLGHRVRDLPCQDAARAVSQPRAALVLADGAGSSAVSELGAQAVVRGLARLIDTLEKPLAEQLDGPETDEIRLRQLMLLCVKHAIGLLRDLAALHRRDIRDFRCTLLLFVTGCQRHAWLKVGDGALVVERQAILPVTTTASVTTQPVLLTLGEMGKGEFANQTCFLDAVSPDAVQTGFLSAMDITGVALMSDGAAERLVAHDGSQVAGRIASLLQSLREDKLRRSTLTRMFYEDNFCQGSTGDDRAIALLACPHVLPAFPVVVPVPEPVPAPEVVTQPAPASAAILAETPPAPPSKKYRRYSSKKRH